MAATCLPEWWLSLVWLTSAASDRHWTTLPSIPEFPGSKPDGKSALPGTAIAFSRLYLFVSGMPLAGEEESGRIHP
jgi:hypothetical protein